MALVHSKYKTLLIVLVSFLSACAHDVQKEAVFFSLKFHDNSEGREIINEISFSEVSTYYYDREKNYLYGYADTIKYNNKIVSQADFYQNEDKINQIFALGIRNKSRCYKSYRKNNEVTIFDEDLCDDNIAKCKTNYNTENQKLISLEIAESYFIKGGYPVVSFGYSEKVDTIEYNLSYYDDCKYIKQDLLKFINTHKDN